MRELSRLKTAPEARSKDERPLWGWRQAVTFLGLLIVVGATAFGAYMQLSRAKEVDYDGMRSEAAQMDVRTAWLFWTVFRDLQIELNAPLHVTRTDLYTPRLPPWLIEGQPVPDPDRVETFNRILTSLIAVHRDLLGDNERLLWIYVAGGIAAFGGVLMAVSYFWPAAAGPHVKKHRARPRTAS